MPGYGITLEKKIKKTHPCFLGPRCDRPRHGPGVAGGWRAPLLRGPGAKASDFLSWKPLGLRAHVCSDSKECWVSTETLGKPSASLCPY